MNAIAAWFLAAVVGFSGLGAGYHWYLGEHPRRVLVVVDSSYPMQADWSSIPRHVNQLETRRYTAFSLYSEKGLVHGWADRINYEKVTAYAPRDFTLMQSFESRNEFEQASEVVLLTNATEAELAPFDNWQIIRLE